jgi:outer membrane cobalamin receptor
LHIQATSFFFGVLVGLGSLVASVPISVAAESDAPVGPAQAESTAFDGAEEMIVSATRTPRSRGSVPNFTTVLEGKDLDTSVSTSLVDALRFVQACRSHRTAGVAGGRRCRCVGSTRIM